ncbi:MAG TPA: GNAT family N-acetyltransferase [Pyrinomonadaceae bacterium]|nr:GNAT family N-acetyltransferase [Pyrinomonadaceae bacterium]
MTQISGLMIRHGTVDDAELLSELGSRTFSETFAADNTEEDITEYLATSFNVAQQTAELEDPASTFLIAEIDGRAAGYAMLRDGEPEQGVEGANPIELVRLYVAREWLGRGLGEQLMRACLDEARQFGHETIWLGVWEQNERAQAFYRKWNFHPFGEHMFQLGSDLQRDILMARPV